MFESSASMSELVGRKLRGVVRENGDEGDGLTFSFDDGSIARMEHLQGCCENVTIEDICGDLSDLVGEVLEAEENSSHDCGSSDDYAEPESCTWTFYRIGTAKGTVTVRWFGQSNGYYSESADLYWVIMPPDLKAELEKRIGKN